jgi:hypothetical protein
VKRLALGLGLASLALAASTLYLARALEIERTKGAAALSGHAPVASPATDAAATPSTATIAPATQDPPAAPHTAPGTVDPQAAALQERLDEFGNPAIRASRVADMKAALASTMSRMAQELQLQPHESARLLDFMAESVVRNQQLATQCRLKPDCDLRSAQQAQARSDLEELERAVGRDVVRRIESLDASERIRSFSSGLPENQALSDATITQLATALAEERRRGLQGSEPADVLQRRLHEHAARLLTAEQLAAFTGQQDAMLSID